MIVYLPFLVFALGGVIAYGSAGRRRQLGTILMIAAAAWALALLGQPALAGWVVGPLIATLLLVRPAERVRSSFEVLSRRAVTVAVFAVAALIFASRLPFGENPLFLNAVPWLLGAVGAAWLLNPIDAVERLQGQVLMVGATGALLIAAIPVELATATAAGATALLPIAGERVRTPSSLRLLLSSLMLLTAGVAAVLAATGAPIGAATVAGVSIKLGGPALLAVAIILVAGALLAPVGLEWASLVGAIAVIAVAAGLRWSALAALVAIATALERDDERPAWLSVASLAAIPFIEATAPAVWSARAQTVALGIGLVLLAYAARQPLLRVLVLPPAVFLVLLAVNALSSGNLTRFQWIAAAGAVLLVAIAMFWRLRATGSMPSVIVGDRLLIGLLLLAISARDALGLGALAVAVLLIDLAMVRVDDVPALRSGFWRRVLELARSDWPPSATFAGAVIAVIATLQASLALGLLAAGWWAALQLMPLLDHQRLTTAPERPHSPLRWLGPVIGLACGVGPAVVLRMLRL